MTLPSPHQTRFLFIAVCSEPLTRSLQQVHSLTDMCFRKCVTSKISAGKLDRSEEPCVMNCVDRYMDANMTVIKHLEQMRQLG